MNNKKIFISGIITLFLLFFLASNITFFDIKQTYSNLSLEIILIGFLLYILTYLFRSIRLRFLIGNNLNLRESFKIISIHNMLNQIFPFKSGDISLIYLLKKKSISFSKSTSILLIFRILDFFSILFLLLLSLFFTKSFYLMFSNSLIYLILISVLLFILCSILLYKSNFIIYLILKIISFFNITKISNFKNFSNNLNKISKNLNNYRKDRKLFGLLFIFSIIIWISSFIFTYYILIKLGLELSILNFVLAMSLVLIFNSLPIHGLFNLGTQETFWTISFVLIGIEKGLAISSGLIVHILVILYFLILGLISMFYNK